MAQDLRMVLIFFKVYKQPFKGQTNNNKEIEFATEALRGLQNLKLLLCGSLQKKSTLGLEDRENPTNL